MLPQKQHHTGENPVDRSAYLASVNKKIAQFNELRQRYGQLFLADDYTFPRLHQLAESCSLADLRSREAQYNTSIQRLARSSYDGWSTLHRASGLGLNEVVADLLKYKAPINGISARGETPLDCAAGFPETIAVLRAAGALTYAEMRARSTRTPSASKPAPQQQALANNNVEIVPPPRPSPSSSHTSPDLPAAGMQDIPLTPLQHSNGKPVKTAPSQSAGTPTPKESMFKKTRRGISSAIDFNNRMLFEAFFEFFTHPIDTWKAYRYDDEGDDIVLAKAFGQYLLGFFARLILLPLTSAVYNLSRLMLIVLNPYAYKHNPAKTSLMRMIAIVAVAILLPVGVLIPSFTESSLQLLSGVATGLGASIGSALIVGALLSIALAGWLYNAKIFAQGWNRHHIENIRDCTTTFTAPKHSFQQSVNHYNGHCNDLLTLHSSTLTLYYSKQKRPAIYGLSKDAKHSKTLLDLIAKTTTQPEKYQEDLDAIRAMVTDSTLRAKLDQYAVVDNMIRPKTCVPRH